MAYDIRLARVLAHHARVATMSNDVQAEAKRGLRMMLTDRIDSQDPISNEVLRLNLTGVLPIFLLTARRLAWLLRRYSGELRSRQRILPRMLTRV